MSFPSLILPFPPKALSSKSKEKHPQGQDHPCVDLALPNPSNRSRNSHTANGSSRTRRLSLILLCCTGHARSVGPCNLGSHHPGSAGSGLKFGRAAPGKRSIQAFTLHFPLPGSNKLKIAPPRRDIFLLRAPYAKYC